MPATKTTAMPAFSARALRERRRNLEIEAQSKARTEAEAVTAGVAETLALEEARGRDFLRPPVRRGERAKPVRRLDGLDWLASKGRLTPRQVQAGRRYEKLFRILETGDVASCLALLEIRGTAGAPAPAEAKTWARFKLAAARAAVGDHAGLVFALDQISGLGLRPREVTTDQRGSERLEDRLAIGLDLLVREWGL